MIKTILKILAFIAITTVLAEYLINRASSTLYTILFVAIEIVLLFLLFYKPIKTLFK
ncbi:MAG TPA: hypothetical protein PLS07_15610 [Niabella sp.]|nr:hypothetical protein [Niabella sp.]HQX18585.1 hypothetical protein [Niabella sp.]HRB06482.1 hypothetical protein [Niabella sp.]HRB44259.1 hypothetical protein [Niabella sp.]HRB60596.1 hypothetical protein [Niabella sp.]